MAAKAYQFRQMLKHEYMKPPTIMPPTEMAEPLSDSQAPIIPPTAMLASNQKIQMVSPKPRFMVRGRGMIVASVGIDYAVRTI